MSRAALFAATAMGAAIGTTECASVVALYGAVPSGFELEDASAQADAPPQGPDDATGEASSDASEGGVTSDAGEDGAPSDASGDAAPADATTPRDAGYDGPGAVALYGGFPPPIDASKAGDSSG